MKRGRMLEDRLVREKLERDLELARSIQQQSFPSELPKLEGFEIEAWTEPAEETGGDTYDVIGFSSQVAETLAVVEHTDTDRAILLMADATGHGVGPALSVTQVRSMLRMAVRMGADLEQIALHMNNQLCHDLPQGRFITAWLAEINATDSSIVSFSAGQAPLLRYSAHSDTFQKLDADTLPLGILDDLPVVIEHEFSMNPGDLFIVLSDGIYEATNKAGKMFDVQRVMDVVREHRAADAQTIAREIRAATDRFSEGEPAADDRTAIVVKRLES